MASDLKFPGDDRDSPGLLPPAALPDFDAPLDHVPEPAEPEEHPKPEEAPASPETLESSKPDASVESVESTGPDASVAEPDASVESAESSIVLQPRPKALLSKKRSGADLKAPEETRKVAKRLEEWQE